MEIPKVWWAKKKCILKILKNGITMEVPKAGQPWEGCQVVKCNWISRKWQTEIYWSAIQWYRMETPKARWYNDWLIVLGFNSTSTLVGHFGSSPRERGKRDRGDSKGDEREQQDRKENEWKLRNRRNKNLPLYPYLLQGQQALPNCKPVSVGCPVM